MPTFRQLQQIGFQRVHAGLLKEVAIPGVEDVKGGQVALVAGVFAGRAAALLIEGERFGGVLAAGFLSQVRVAAGQFVE